ncbi:hypothetical protein B0H19DRAFT_1077024 [Mycena capillaripes]|nr:hypothetical protein B0H19DRAFT_1077024 [Mycena capillaripes]
MVKQSCREVGGDEDSELRHIVAVIVHGISAVMDAKEEITTRWRSALEPFHKSQRFWKLRAVKQWATYMQDPASFPASRFFLPSLTLLNHSSSSAPRKLHPGFSTSHTLDFGLRTDRAAAECLVLFAQFPETLCLSSVPNEALNGAILVHR